MPSVAKETMTSARKLSKCGKGTPNYNIYRQNLKKKFGEGVVPSSGTSLSPRRLDPHTFGVTACLPTCKFWRRHWRSKKFLTWSVAFYRYGWFVEKTPEETCGDCAEVWRMPIWKFWSSDKGCTALEQIWRRQLKTSVQEQHKLTYAALAPHSAIRFPTSNYITYIKIVEIGAKLEELQVSSYDISNRSYFSIFSHLKMYARKTAQETYAVFDLSRPIVKAWRDLWVEIS